MVSLGFQPELQKLKTTVPGTLLLKIQILHCLKDPKTMGIMVYSFLVGNAGFTSSSVGKPPESV